MAKNNENDLIGYDPLAWMVSEAEINKGLTDSKCDDNEKEREELQSVEENFEAVDEYSGDLIEDTEENASMEEDLAGEVELDSDKESNEDIVSGGFEGVQSQDTDDLEAAFQNSTDDGEIESSQIDLDAVLSIQHVIELHEKLKKVLSVHDEIEINASDVSSIDTSTLQLLVSLKKDAPKLQKRVSIIYPSPRFVESARLLGLSDVLEVYDA